MRGGHGPPDFSKFPFIILIKWEKRINFMEIKIPAPPRILRLENIQKKKNFEKPDHKPENLFTNQNQ